MSEKDKEESVNLSDNAEKIPVNVEKKINQAKPDSPTIGNTMVEPAAPKQPKQKRAQPTKKADTNTIAQRFSDVGSGTLLTDLAK